VRPLGLSELKTSFISSSLEPATFRLIAQCLNHYTTACHPSFLLTDIWFAPKFWTIQIIILLRDLWLMELKCCGLLEVRRKRRYFFYSDVAAYMLKAGIVWKVIWPNLIQFTCHAQGLQCVMKEVRAKFPQINKLISWLKEVRFWKPHIHYNHKQHLPDPPLPTEPMPTRWGAWTEAVNFYSEYFEALKSWSIYRRYVNEISAASDCENII
jgi:hypothetical protein